VLEQNEKRIVRIEKLMREIIRESETLHKMERELLADSRSKGANELELASELKMHRSKIVAILKEAQEAMKVPTKNDSFIVGGLLLEIDKHGLGEGTSHETH